MPRMSLFYSEAEAAIRALSVKHGLHFPAGHATVDRGVLHVRLSIHEHEPGLYWEMQWVDNKEALDLGDDIRPGDSVVDQEGRQWVLLGLDPASERFPVRLESKQGDHVMISIPTMKTLQKMG